MWRALLASAALFATVCAYDADQGQLNVHLVYSSFQETGVDNAYSESNGKQRKYTCKASHLKVMRGCKDSGDGKTEDGLPCYAPEFEVLRKYKKEDGDHGIITCSKDDGYAKIVNSDGITISYGEFETSKVVKCSKYGDWIAQNIDGNWVILKNVYCIFLQGGNQTEVATAVSL